MERLKVIIVIFKTWGMILAHTLTLGIAKNGDFAHVILNFVPSVRHCEFITSF